MDMDKREGIVWGSGGWAGQRRTKGETWDNFDRMAIKHLIKKDGLQTNDVTRKTNNAQTQTKSHQKSPPTKSHTGELGIFFLVTESTAHGCLLIPIESQMVQRTQVAEQGFLVVHDRDLPSLGVSAHQHPVSFHQQRV